ncbi:MAG TPA: TlpA disulfide reductase family protein [Chthoniobacteraceae bacterium]|nr:TlpA disulfide reductase family protein [Chthoniobacteraceae bacterium]
MKIAVSLFAALLLGALPVASRAQAPGQAPATTPTPPPASPDTFKTADALWQHVQDLRRGPKERPQTEAEYDAMITTMYSQIDTAITAFLKRYPNDPRQWEAKLLQINAKTIPARVSGQRLNLDEVRAEIQPIADAKNAPEDVRKDARRQLLLIAVSSLREGDKTVTGDSIVNQIHQFATDFPNDAGMPVDKYKIAMALKDAAPDASNTLLKELAASGQGRLADMAGKQLSLADELKAPLNLHFTAVDGTPVDLSKMRGKVVLIDFWATWCGPCKLEVPNVVETYRKLHDKGFEIIGISLDQDKDSLLKYTAANGMTWPQYFDGKGWQNEISSSFAIQQIPTMWLVNKKGYVVSMNGRVNLENQVKNLLAE